MLDPKKIRSASILAVFFLTLSFIPSVFADIQKVYGKAFNSDGELVYLEEHVLRYENGKIVAIETTFYNADVQQIARQVSDFSLGAQFGSYDFVDKRHRYADGVRVMSDRILIYSQKNPAAEAEKKYIARKSNQIVGQGFYHFVAANLESVVPEYDPIFRDWHCNCRFSSADNPPYLFACIRIQGLAK